MGLCLAVAQINTVVNCHTKQSSIDLTILRPARNQRENLHKFFMHHEYKQKLHVLINVDRVDVSCVTAVGFYCCHLQSTGLLSFRRWNIAFRSEFLS